MMAADANKYWASLDFRRKPALRRNAGSNEAPYRGDIEKKSPAEIQTISESSGAAISEVTKMTFVNREYW